MLPGGPRNARQLQQMMRRLGMTTEDVENVEEVIVRTRDKEHVFQHPEVTVLTVQGVRTYQVVGTPEIRARSGGSEVREGPPTEAAPRPAGPPEEDIELVMSQAGVEREDAIAALSESEGAPAEAILRLLSRKGARGPG